MFQAPEVFAKMPYEGKPADVFALGVCLWILLTGALPFEQSTDDYYNHLMYNTKEYMATQNVKLSKKAAHLILRMLHPNPDERFTMA
jgi:[calcium/calmodulin-dependent protein kinase] kinase